MIPALIVLSVLAAALCLTSCASRGVPTRKVINAEAGVPQPDPAAGSDPASAWYIEGPADAGGKPYSCSFIEFDDRGDYLDFAQHRHAYEKIKHLSGDQRLAVVIFLHGWRNNSQSGNVTGFVTFLRQLAQAEHVRKQGLRVHGVYLGWRGGVFKPSPVTARDDQETGFPRSIVQRKASSRIPAITNVLETFAYWIDKSLPEYKISGTSMSRSIYTCAHTAKRHGEKERNRVFLMGHSFGALLLERTFMNSTLGELTKEWAWDKPNENTKANPLPFDAVLLVNSAAPSIYAKQFQGYLAAHRQAMVRDGVKGADAPVFISLTSEGDKATSLVHPIGNLFSGMSPTLQRNYHGYSDFILQNPKNDSQRSGPVVPQAEYYKRTPGHNPLLVNRWVEGCQDAHIFGASIPNCMDENLKLDVTRDEAMHFLTTGEDGRSVRQWAIKLAPDISPANATWSSWHGHKPVCWDRGEGVSGKDRGQSAYWIMRCPKEIIHDHNDIWNQKAMETYAALFRTAEVMRQSQ